MKDKFWDKLNLINALTSSELQINSQTYEDAEY